MTPALHQAERVYAGGRGFVLELNTGENWAVTDTLIYPGMVFNQLAQDESGWLWGLQFRILGMKFGQSPISTLMLDSLRGWNPKLSTALMARIGGQLLFYSKHTAVTYDREKEELKAISGYGGLLEKGNFELVKELDANKLFLSKDGLAGVAARLESGWAWDTLAGKALPQTALHYAMQWDNYLYLGTDEGLFQLKLENSAYPSPEFQVILKQVSAGADLVLPLQGKVAEIDAASNNVEFSFIATEFDHPEAVVYRHRLAGYNATWSAWSKRTYAEYTNLGGGEYTFEVQGKNQLGRKSEVADFAFHLATPWYLQTWAWLGYVALGLLFLSGVIRLRTRALSRANLRLEAIVQERTQEIASQKTLILEEKKETEKQRDRAEESERIKKRFFANMTHELRTPLTLILGPAAQIKAEVSSPAGKQQVSLIERNGKRLLRLINQLLDISRVESAQMEIHAIRLDAVSFVRNVVANFSVAAEAKGIALTFTCGLKDLKVDFDPEKMEKILFNLLSNAIKFTENGKIEIELKKAVVGGEDVFQIRVIDSGKGIPKADQAFVFDRFYQSQHGRNKVGSGIGMALTKELVVLHGGQIGLKSEVGHGTEFWVEMPTRQENVQDATDNELLAQQADLYLLADPHEEAVNNLPTAAEAISEDGKNLVLVVEDNADVRAYIVSCIPKTFRVMQAVDGEQGLEMATQWVPDLVISDVMMPKMDGYELTTALKNAEATSHIPVILLTSRAEADSRLQGLETGADAYLTKPFNPAELKLRIRKLIALRALLRDRFKGEGLLKPGKVQATSTEEAFVLRVKHLIEERLGDEQLQVEDMAQVVNLSKVQFSRKFKALTGTTPNKYLRKFRLDIARQLIQQGAGTIAEIGFKVGFSSAAYFSKCFLDEFGMSPTALGQQ
ncbi:MAG TPA: response regulator [Bacteroidetes bacterium]|nr:response regulator [Bacteroidota bacterium]